MRLSALLVATALLALPLAASADTLQYSFTGNDGYGNTDSFSFTLPSNTGTDFNPIFVASTFFNGDSISDVADVNFSPGFLFVDYLSEGAAFYLYYPSSPLYIGSTLQTGMFSFGAGSAEAAPDGYIYDLSGTLTVTDLATAATPEPSSLALLGTGLLTLTGVLRRKLLA